MKSSADTFVTCMVFNAICAVIVSAINTTIQNEDNETDSLQNNTFPKNCELTINKCSEKIIENSIKLPVNTDSSNNRKNTSACAEAIRGNIFEFQLKVKTPDCPDTKEFDIFYSKSNYDSSINKNITSTNNQSVVEFDNYFNPFIYYKKGKKLIDPENYCISKINKASLRITACISNSSNTSHQHHYINKCCPLGSYLKLNASNPNMRECVELRQNNETWIPYLYKKTEDGNFKRVAKHEEKRALIQLKIENFTIGCNQSKIRTPNAFAVGYQRAQIRVTTSGKIYTRTSGNHKWVAQKTKKDKIHTMCIDSLLDLQSSAFETTEENQIVMYCDDYVMPNMISTMAYVHITMMILSSIFLIFVVVTYALVCDKQNIHGWTVATYSFCMLTFLTCKVIADCYRFKSQDENSILRVGTTSCFLLGVFIHFFLVSEFSWMAVINFDLWLTIGSISPIKGSTAEKKRFLYYALFGFGIPTLVISISLFVDLNFGYFDDTVIRPQYGQTKCGLEKHALLYYELIFCFTLFGLSLFLSCLTLRVLVVYMQQTKRLQEEMMPNNRNIMYDQRIKLLSKLFVLLAFSWVFEIGGILWSFLDHKSRWYVILFDIHNFIQSIGFFWIFVCKKEIKQQLSVKYRIFEEAFYWLDEKMNTHSDTLNTKAESRSYTPNNKVSMVALDR